jgi:hypothetical protein
MFLQKLKIKKLIYIVLFVISGFSYVSWLSFDIEKKRQFLSSSLGYSKDNFIKVLDFNNYVSKLETFK